MSRLQIYTISPITLDQLFPLGLLVTTFLCIFTVTRIILWTPPVLTIYSPSSEAGLRSFSDSPTADTVLQRICDVAFT